MKNVTYSLHITEAIRNHLDAHRLHYHFDEDHGVFELLMGVGCKAKTLVYHIIIDQYNFVVNARYPMGPSAEDEACVNTIARFFSRANYGLRNGNFELDLDDGEISFKSFCCCRGLTAPSDEMIAESIQFPAAMFDKYEAGILGILFNGMSDKEADDLCENGKSNMLTRLEELKARLEALERRESKEADVDDEEEKDEEENPGSSGPDGKDAPFSFEAFLRMIEEKAASASSGEDGMPDADIIDAE